MILEEFKASDIGPDFVRKLNNLVLAVNTLIKVHPLIELDLERAVRDKEIRE